MHVASESVALITKPLWIEDAGVSVDAFNLTSLVDASPKVMLNYQIDDYGTDRPARLRVSAARRRLHFVHARRPQLQQCCSGRA